MTRLPMPEAAATEPPDAATTFAFAPFTALAFGVVLLLGGCQLADPDRPATPAHPPPASMPAPASAPVAQSADPSQQAPMDSISSASAIEASTRVLPAQAVARAGP